MGGPDLSMPYLLFFSIIIIYGITPDWVFEALISAIHVQMSSGVVRCIEVEVRGITYTHKPLSKAKQEDCQGTGDNENKRKA